VVRVGVCTPPFTSRLDQTKKAASRTPHASLDD